MHLIVRPGSVVDLEVDAIVNAANTRLANGGGLAGAISRAAGPQLDADCRRVAPCPTGDVRVTPGYQLPATYVIHAVGPIWRGGTDGEEALLRSAYRRIVAEANRLELRTIGVAPLSIGIFGYPEEEGCRIALEELCAPSLEGGTLDTITVMGFNDHLYRLLLRLHGEVDPAYGGG